MRTETGTAGNGMKAGIKTVALVGALSLGGSLFAETKPQPAPESPPDAESAPQTAAASETKAAIARTASLQELIQYFREQRADFLLARQQLRQQLAAAETAEERRRLIIQFRKDNLERIQAQRELRREFRRRRMDIRRARRAGQDRE